MLSKSEHFTEIFQSHPTQNLIRNLTAKVDLTEIDQLKIPVTISDSRSNKNHYFVSPKTAYIDYTFAQKNPFNGLKEPLQSVMKIPTMFIARVAMDMLGLERQIQVNNWLLSTCPTPVFSERSLEEFIQKTSCKRPNHAIVLRSVNAIQDPETLATLRNAGFVMLPNRIVYIQSLSKNTPTPRNLKKDSRLIRKTGFTQRCGKTFSEVEFERAEQLYNKLYLEKYSRLNPQYTALFLKEMVQREVIDMYGVFDNMNHLKAWVCTFRSNGKICAPMAGYDASNSEDKGLYRILSWIAHDVAIKEGLSYNMSSGAADFKLKRGARPTVEYMAVYAKHLPQHKQFLIQKLSDALRAMLHQRFPTVQS
ncbi:hypothetical protein GCM10007094_41390 [Pseudovibrio japonicus]|uniref:BioF2-like acetyltransferase domain-containing protein n=1 Tax=Pseudovibrio japonicus TaxID=366534 RepID=A0ABQ3ESA2_9HYPH|nr:hypothetical protein [Pseudovibrio japonicus]GHB47808.1 hypothetical protein GCM10007094_41390 [Pseudovibrio japonicus]